MASQQRSSSTSPAFSSVLQILLAVASAGLLGFAYVYLYPIVHPLVTEGLSQARSFVGGWWTPPVLFVLLNAVVGALYVSSGMAGSKKKKKKKMKQQGEEEEEEKGEELEEEEDEEAEERREGGDGGGALRAVWSETAVVEAAAAAVRLRARTRLVRSKSEQIYATGAGAGGVRLKKSGTFEGAARGPRPVVVVPDLPEEEGHGAGAAGNEVDQKAEAFIGRFYQRVKLQRLDSLLRSRQQQGG